MRDIKQAKEVYETLFKNDDWIQEDKEFKEIMKRYVYGDIYNYGSLDNKLRELIVIVVQTVNHSLHALKRHIEAGIVVGLSPTEIKEAIYQCSPYVGLAKVEDAVIVMNSVFNHENISLLPQPLQEETRFEKGFAVQSLAFGKEHIQAGHDQAPQELKHIQQYLSEHCFGDFYTREGLDLKIRELLTFVMLATLGGCENQLRAHTGANIRVGNTREILIETITQCQPYIGFPRTLNAIAIINEVTKKVEECKIDREESLGPGAIYPLGDKNDAYADYFVGQSYLYPLTTTGVAVSNVTFEPGCRNNWHIHHLGGQILLVTGGMGYYQEWGKPVQILKAGDVVNILAEVKHWHGAMKNSWFSHLSIAVPVEGATNEWLEPVDDEHYNSLPYE